MGPVPRFPDVNIAFRSAKVRTIMKHPQDISRNIYMLNAGFDEFVLNPKAICLKMHALNARSARRYQPAALALTATIIPNLTVLIKR